MKKWRSLAENGNPPVGTVCAYGVDDTAGDPTITELWAKGDKVEILAYRDDYAVIYNSTQEAADIRNLDYGDEGPLVVALDESVNDAPDWDNAPEGATHWEPRCIWYASWVKQNGDNWYFWSRNKDNWTKYQELTEARIKAMIPRPQVKPKEWNGDGLPPIGAVCELWVCGVFDDVVEFIGIRNKYTAVFWRLERDVPDAGELPTVSFRPLRSEEDRAIEEIVEYIKSARLRGLSISDQGAKAFALQLYRAGYRKQEKK